MSDGDAGATSRGFLSTYFGRVGEAVESRSPVLVLTLASLGLVFIIDLVKAIPAMSNTWQVPSVLLAFAIVTGYLWGTWATNVRSGRVEQLERENEALRRAVRDQGRDYLEHCSKRLSFIAGQLGFRGSDRVSLYRFDGDNFVMIGRYSEQPELKVPGRAIYPAGQGVIGMAWRSAQGRSFVDNLPDPAANLGAYKEENLRRFNFPPEVVDGMAMKSRTIGAYVLKDLSGLGRAAVLVFESLEATRFTDADLGEVVAGPHGRDLSLLIDIMKPQAPSPGLARAKGF
jgi:hypothetical protein